MTDRIRGFTVTLDRDMRDDDFEYVENAIKMIKGVASVIPDIVTHEDYKNREAIRHELHRKLIMTVNKFFEETHD